MGVLDRFRLDGRVALVTGASSGLGVAFAQALAEAGADVAVGARRQDRVGGGARRQDRLAEAANLVEAAGRRALALRLDVADPASCRSFADEAMSRFGR